ncbi:MAG TPA: glutathione peroxidase [Bacillota bacterium]|nr:glutathione peroxidase [Bacillota bacterium]
MMSVHQFSAKLITGEDKPLADYEGNVLLIVNTATQCGFTPQLEGLEKLHQTYQDEGFSVLGFPCNQFGNQEPGTNEEVAETCSMEYGVNFPLFEKIDVNGEDAHPLYQYLTSEAKGVFSGKIKWNFTKFLVDRDGKVVERFAPTTKPEKIEEHVKELL